MTPKEFFACEPDRHQMSDYWQLEFLVADHAGAPWTSADYWPAEARMCSLCGSICHTDDNGRLPAECPDTRCQQVRDFWNIYPFPQNTHLNSGNKSRYAFVRYRLLSALGYKTLSHVPREVALPFLTSLMIERIVDEQDNPRPENHAI